jgi:hypothetical protein
MSPVRTRKHRQLDVDDLARGVGSVKKKADVGTVAGHYIRPKFSGSIGHHRVYYVARASAAEQPPGGVRPLLGKAHHLTTLQQSAELDLRWRPADLNDDWSGYHGNDARLQPDSVLCPDAARVAVRRN